MARGPHQAARVVAAPAALLRGPAALPPNCVTSVVLNPGEEVRWIWTHMPSGSYVSGYTIVEASPVKKTSKAKRRTRAKR